MIRLERERETVSVVDDQCGSPTWSRDLADGLIALAESDAAFGTYHFTNSGLATWCDFARAVFEELGSVPPVCLRRLRRVPSSGTPARLLGPESRSVVVCGATELLVSGERL